MSEHSWSPRRLFATGSNDTYVLVWDLSEFICINSIARHDGSVTALSFSHDSALIASTCEDASYIDIVRMYNTKPKMMTHSMLGVIVLQMTCTFHTSPPRA